MATQFSMLSIMNAALTSQGLDEIVSEYDGTPEFRAMQRNWPGIVEAELEDGAYNFTKTEENLLTRIDGKFGFTDGYQLPGDVLHVRRLWTMLGTARNLDVDWVQDGEYVYLESTDGCWIDAVKVVDEDLWSANFSTGVQRKLEAVLRRVLEEPGEAAALEQQAEIYFQRARTNSSKARAVQKPYRSSRFADARFGRSGT